LIVSYEFSWDLSKSWKISPKRYHPGTLAPPKEKVSPWNALYRIGSTHPQYNSVEHTGTDIFQKRKNYKIGFNAIHADIDSRVPVSVVKIRERKVTKTMGSI